MAPTPSGCFCGARPTGRGRHLYSVTERIVDYRISKLDVLLPWNVADRIAKTELAVATLPLSTPKDSGRQTVMLAGPLDRPLRSEAATRQIRKPIELDNLHHAVALAMQLLHLPAPSVQSLQRRISCIVFFHPLNMGTDSDSSSIIVLRQ